MFSSATGQVTISLSLINLEGKNNGTVCTGDASASYQYLEVTIKLIKEGVLSRSN